MITPDEHVEIPKNVPLRVMIEPAVERRMQAVNWDTLFRLATECAIEGPEDLAERHDDYSHGNRAD